ncbi:MAG: outer membrane protein transport protein [Tepidiphilus sp.]|nr:outer membrane protein transport protein [Tepidiphilus sp.]
MKKKLLAVVVPSLFAASSTALASGFQLSEQSASGIGNAYAGSAALAEDAGTIFYNPAGMTRLGAREVSLGLSLVKPSFKFKNDGSMSLPGVPMTGSNGGDAGDWAAVPNGYYSHKINDRLWVGIGVGVPFGLMTEYRDDWIGRFHSTKFDIKTININPSIAFKVNEMMSLGLGVSVQRFEATYDRYAAVAAPPPLNSLRVSDEAMQRTKLRLEADDVSWGWNAGLLLTPTETTKIGFSYRSKVKQKLDGDLKAHGPAAAVLDDPRLGLAGVDAKVSVDLPDTFIASVAQGVGERWELLADVSWTGWSSLNVLPIYRSSGAQAGTVADALATRFQDTWRVALGARYRYDERWLLKFGVAYDESPVRDAERRLTALPDNDRIWVSFGARWSPDRDNRVDLGLAYLFINDTRIDRNAIDEGKGWVRGKYEGDVWLAGVQYSRAF